MEHWYQGTPTWEYVSGEETTTPSHPLPWQMSLDKILISKYITNIHLSIINPHFWYLAKLITATTKTYDRSYFCKSSWAFSSSESLITINFILITYHSSLFGMIYLTSVTLHKNYSHNFLSWELCTFHKVFLQCPSINCFLYFIYLRLFTPYLRQSKDIQKRPSKNMIWKTNKFQGEQHRTKNSRIWYLGPFLRPPCPVH